MNKTLSIAAITLVAVVMGMSAMAPAFAGGGPPPEEKESCDALRDALDKGNGNKKGIEIALINNGCLLPCEDNTSVPARMGIEPPCV